MHQPSREPATSKALYKPNKNTRTLKLSQSRIPPNWSYQRRKLGCDEDDATQSWDDLCLMSCYLKSRCPLRDNADNATCKGIDVKRGIANSRRINIEGRSLTTALLTRGLFEVQMGRRRVDPLDFMMHLQRVEAAKNIRLCNQNVTWVWYSPIYRAEYNTSDIAPIRRCSPNACTKTPRRQMGACDHRSV